MGLFNRKKTPEPIKPSAPAKTVNADDIFGTPSVKPKQVNADDIFGTPSVKPKTVNADDIFGTPSPRKASAPAEPLDGPASINPDDIKKKMQELEQELAEKSAQPKVDYSQYGLVDDSEVADAQEKYEAIYKEEHERYLQSHVQDISSANTDDISSMVDSMMSEVNAHRAKEAAKVYEVSQVSDEEVAKGMSELQQAPKDETKDSLYQSISEINDADALSSMVDSMMNEVNAHRAKEAAKVYEVSQVSDEELAKSMASLPQAPKR